ncbi:hypothetical protein LTS18_004856 [Coniosporium uncinatum]|uniref:Uncharacterized protein n=1 Tax=Coniosporium uncinatum TaxID=93489 RepID=A0ACC3D5G8_9PEZI|nr:hypothetical protein LTS18_004856 [Coniosporium uncinatum]
MFTGLGALVALGLFLPLPTRFEKSGVTAGEAVADSFYVVGAVALLIAACCSLGLRNLPAEEGKSWRRIFNSSWTSKSPSEHSDSAFGKAATTAVIPYSRLLAHSFALGFRDVNIGLGYLGGFVARASSVAISLFIPLFVNGYFISHGLCDTDPNAPNDDLKKTCRHAYVLASILTGTSQLVALVCAPVFGWLASRYTRYNIPLLVAAVAGIVGYVAFGLLKSPDYSSEDGSTGVFFVVALLGISQIGAIVCSLGILGRGIQTEDETAGEEEEEEEEEGGGGGGQGDGADGGALETHASRFARSHGDMTPLESPAATSTNLRDPMAEQGARQAMTTTAQDGSGDLDESAPLLLPHPNSDQFRRGGGLGNGSGSGNNTTSRAKLKGSIAGMYSLAGGAGILILTKVGGVMFDDVDRGAPFFLMAGFNAVLLVVGMGCAGWEVVKGRRRRRMRRREER